MTGSPDEKRYAELRDSARVREPVLFATPRTFNELELQARWFAGDFGDSFVSTAGDEIEVVQFGTWNREAGPDFRDAAVRINGRDPIRGCVEIDLIDRNWETHGHATNPAFETTVLHVFVDKSDREFFTRTKANRNVPQVRIDPTTLPDAFSANIPLARPGRCQGPLRKLPNEQVHSVLDAAAQFRLKQKAARIRNKIDIRQSGSDHARNETLFQEVAAALGYKENKLPFTLLAQRFPLTLLRERSDDCEALLFGGAGFLRAPDLAVYKRSTKNYVRELWDKWWPHRDELQRFVLPPKLWKISGTRPVNHPQRRLAALSVLVREWPAFRRMMERAPASETPAATVTRFFAGLDHTFWKFHYTLTAQASSKAMALIGESRTAEILANVLFPFWSAEGVDIWSDYAKLPARLSNRRLETGATRLFGDDPRRKEFLKTTAHQQGLLQIYEDFCLQDNSDCAQCPFPEQMGKWH
jgi:Protein of unknown function (DUF2851)